MKKFNFFPVLFLALFLLCGFESSAQTYKPTSEAIVSVVTAISESQSSITATNQSAGATITPIVSQSIALENMKIEVGKALLAQFKNNSDVATALVTVTSQFSVNAQRESYKAQALAFYKTLLTI